jgi:hypothetical protein
MVNPNKKPVDVIYENQEVKKNCGLPVAERQQSEFI